MKIIMTVLLLGFTSIATADTHSDYTERAIAAIKVGAGNFLTCSIAIRSSFSMMDTIPGAVDENGEAVEIRIHSIAQKILDESKRVFATVGVDSDTVDDIAAGKRTQWLYLNEHEKQDVLEECAKALSGGK